MGMGVSMYKLFKDLVIGDVFKFYDDEFVKLADNEDYTKPLDKQLHPNAIALRNCHYVVIGANAKVERVKERLSDAYSGNPMDADDLDDRR